MGLKLLVFFILIFPEGLNAVALQASTNPVPLGTNVTINVQNCTNITSGAWLFESSLLFMWFSSTLINGSAYTNGISLNRTSFGITIPTVNMNRTGLYVFESTAVFSCRAEITLEVQEPVGNVSISVSKSNLVEFNESVTFTCSGRGTPMFISWQNRSSALTALDRIQLSTDGQILTINPVMHYDKGPFKCVVANNISRTESAQINLTISYGPSRIAISGPTDAAVGSSVTFNCSAASYPQSEYRWYFRGVKVGEGSLLMAGPVNSSGQYICVAINNVTGLSMNTSMTLNVFVPVSTVTLNTGNQQPVFNQSFTLTCVVTGNVTSIQWMKNGVPIVYNNRITFSIDNTTIMISPLTLSDNGQYQCVARNPVSNMTSMAYNLTVNYGPWNTTISGPTVGGVGSNVTFNCSANCLPFCLYSLFFNGSKVADGSGHTFRGVGVGNGGQYTCMAYNNVTRSSSNASVNLIVINPVSTVSVTINNQQPVLNQSFTLTCNVTGNVTSIQWMKNSVTLVPNSRTTFSIDNTTMTINPLTLSDNGQYQCVARNPVSNMTSMAYNLTVNYGPWNATISGPTVGGVGSNVTFNCSANCLPLCLYSLFFNGSKVADGSVHTFRGVGVGNGGQYTCMAYNNVTRSSSNASLHLSLIYPISAVTVINNQQPVINQNLTLTCNSVGNASSFQWMRNGSNIAVNNRTTFSGDNSTLRLNPVTPSDEGQYQCTARNPVSSMTSVAYNLRVNYGPQNTTITGPSMAEVGTSVTFSCSAVSYPHCLYIWFFNGSQVANTSNYIIQSATLNNTGRYTCNATNSVTGYSNAATLNFTVFVGISSVQVIANPAIPQASEIQQFMCQVNGPCNHIRWLKDNQTLQASQRVQISADNTTVTFTPLQSADDASYRCVATNIFRSHESPPYQLVANYGPVNVQILVKPGYMTTLTCKAESQPSAVYQWIIDHNSTIVTNQATIQVPIQSILGFNYTCVARNPLTNVTVYTSHYISEADAAVNAHASAVLTILFALLLPVLNEWL